MPMLHSMTAFASRTGADARYSWSLELRGVNAKGLDIRLRLPEQMAALEAEIRGRLQKRFSRGNISGSLRIEQSQAAAGVSIDAQMVEAYMDAAIEIGKIAEAKKLALPAPDAADFLGMRGVIRQSDEPSDDLPTAAILADVDAAIDAFAQMRAAEGAALATVMTTQLEEISRLTDQAAALARDRKQAQAEKLRENLALVMADASAADPDRVAQELALIVVKSDITEEIDRLQAHVAAARDLLGQSGPVGRKLDFLMQEFNREANTLCSKAQAAELTRTGLELKTIIDQMREQVQNVE